MNPTYDFHDHVAVITGAGSGMGFATAQAFAESGAAVACDVSDEEQIAALVERTVASFGRLDFAFNNAGIQAPPTDAADEPAEIFDRVNAINLRGVWACMKHELRPMRAQGSGAIVNCSAKLNKWESKVIEAEICRDDVVGWLRNPERKDWSLCVPYRLRGVHPLYPDFLVVRNTPGGLEVDLLDPHLLSLEDAPWKAAGLAEYADKHWTEFGRIELIIMEGDEIKRLDLTDGPTRNRVRGVQTPEHLRQLYESV